ncbi:hypothetical protein DIZ27_43135 [Streptomyces sp. NWU339]|uniref:magnesium chelatase domain-containing protein n=1 Tax=Streptomyces sp. NWU339 TaxID=2185284 RepID=UPI000D67F5F2|nr:magnesium chelatase domain-containing protein [Streptomyces sp. NWU339]PWI04799.1 hypothetical protein DIZ27_43135 [Streptomyces sp. NWU339]
MASIARPTRLGVISNGVLTEDGNPFNLKYAVLAAQPGDVLEDVTTPNYVAGGALYRTGLVVDADQRGLGVAWPIESDAAGQGRATVRASNEAAVVHVHATISPGLGSFTIDGIGVSSERETKDRIRAAVVNSGYGWPMGRVTVTVEKTTGRPAGSAYDLAIACAILGAAGHYGLDALTRTVLIGELGLDGRVRHVDDVPARIRTAQAASFLNFLVPVADFDEASQNTDVTVLGPSTLGAAIGFLEEMGQA